ncbi:hypothetical protein BDZ97DRAFT_1017462 [Flammula alnicola]|nr:hypothetical protein BDZ97DRAFT_1017462 [Flammula alnicola]
MELVAVVGYAEWQMACASDSEDGQYFPFLSSTMLFKWGLGTERETGLARRASTALHVHVLIVAGLSWAFLDDHLRLVDYLAKSWAYVGSHTYACIVDLVVFVCIWAQAWDTVRERSSWRIIRLECKG